MKIAVICGGPGLERGISLNSTRSIVDHLDGENIEIIPFYLDYQKKAYKISKAQLYSNTPSDFDFKLTHHKYSNASHPERAKRVEGSSSVGKPLSKKTFIAELKKTNLIFPAIHGQYGEDGGLQSFLEQNNIPFVGAGSEATKQAFDKYKAHEFLKSQNFYTAPTLLLKIYDSKHKTQIENFFKEHIYGNPHPTLSQKERGRVIVKPASGGSSIGVYSVNTPKQALEKAELLFSKRMDTRVVIEPFAEGREFTIIILQNRFGQPTALIPTEIEADYSKHQIFDYRKKYLPTRAVTYHCPPRFEDDVIRKIQIQAEQLFSAFGFQDFARFDGWILNDTQQNWSTWPKARRSLGEVWFSDFNPISGMEQNSFLFQQASRVGFTHRGILTHIIDSAIKRLHLPIAYHSRPATRDSRLVPKKPVAVLFGGQNSERQVSLMSGTNVWLKLRRSKEYEPTPYLLDTENNLWKIPYQLALNHTVEEIQENCEGYGEAIKRLKWFETDTRLRLGYSPENQHKEFGAPKKLTLNELVQHNKFIFIALHGGIGEDGTLQSILEKTKVKFNGSNSTVSKLAMNKWLTAEAVELTNIPGVSRIPSLLFPLSQLGRRGIKGEGEIRDLWQQAKNKLNSKTLIIKPTGDGCSTGVAHLFSEQDLEKYLKKLIACEAAILPGTLTNQTEIIKLPKEPIKEILLESFVSTDNVQVKNNQLKHTKISSWVEITVGVLEQNKMHHAFNPSITVSAGEVLSLEEKFQGGTGINITPPPEKLVSKKSLRRAKKLIETLSKKIGIQGYARVDAFLNLKTGALKIIEINTLPGLTASTVLYHQALTEKPPIYPRELLEKIIQNSGY